ncbi:type II restriction endonuclease subunit R [Candidatus Parcubacteria bacterium]|nr:MAG: type II restriction endonuclease subunit R [Candidatus Parcubacteria bacterium]
MFQEPTIIAKIQSKLPELFYLAELESSRAGRVGMEVGSVREKILIALLIYQFGRENVNAALPIHEPETDVIVSGTPISIKSITGRHVGGVKLIWTVDREQALDFSRNYEPRCDMLLAHINWGGVGGLYYFPQSLQMELMTNLGRERYIKLPKPGTNPRGVEMSSLAARSLAAHPRSFKIPVKWVRKQIEFDPYQRWLKYWEQE